MPPRRVYVAMAEHVGNQIYIAGLAVQISAECGAKLVRADTALQWYGCTGILFDHLFDGTHAHAAALKAQKRGMFMTGQSINLVTRLKIIFQALSYFV